MPEILAMSGPEERQLWESLTLGYTEVKGLPLLREEIARVHYPFLTANQILCFAGAEDGIFCALFALCQPEDHMIILTPCYQSLLEMGKIKGCDITTVELQESNGWRLDLAAIKQAIKPNTKWLIMNFPHNPTGQILTAQEQKDLICLLDRSGIWVFSDEVYWHLGPSQTTWPTSMASVYPRAISLGVMSKAYGMAGLRIGWLACQNTEILYEIEKMKHYTSICNSGLSEIITLTALRRQEEILARNTAIIDQNLTILDHFMEEYYELFSWVRPQGGCTGFVKYHAPESVEDFCQRLLQATGVLLLPASVYDYPSNHFRIGFGRRNMGQALEKLSEFL